MSNDKMRLDQDFFGEFEEFDPLEGLDDVFDEDDEVGDQVPIQRDLGVNPNPVIEAAEDPRPASERIATLFEEMQPQRRTLYGVLELCAERQGDATVIAFIEECLAKRHSVFTPTIICSHLERAGALEKVLADGAPYVHEPQPTVVVEDGVEYLQPGTPPEVYWQTTEEGAAFVASDEPSVRLASLLEAQAAALPLFKTILGMASAEGGTTAKALARLIDRDPVNKKNRIFSSRFVEMLYKAGALDWEGTWVITDLGKVALKTIEGKLEELEARQEERAQDDRDKAEARAEAHAFAEADSADEADETDETAGEGGVEHE